MATKEVSQQLFAQFNKKCKRNKLIPQPNGKFLSVKCTDCQSTTVIYTHSQTKVVCQGCGYVIITPKGGKGELGEKIKFRIAGKKND